MTPEHHKFLRLPNTAGWLTILNCTFWLAVGWAGQNLHGSWDWIIIPLGFVFSMPLACALMFLTNANNLHTPTGLLNDAIILGANSFIWGYGLAAIWNSVTAKRRNFRELQMRLNHLCVNCGYDIRATPDRCPECGSVVHWKGFTKYAGEVAEKLDEMR